MTTRHIISLGAAVLTVGLLGCSSRHDMSPECQQYGPGTVAELKCLKAEKRDRDVTREDERASRAAFPSDYREEPQTVLGREAIKQQ